MTTNPGPSLTGLGSLGSRTRLAPVVRTLLSLWGANRWPEIWHTMTQSTARSSLLIALALALHACSCAGGPQPAPPLNEGDSGTQDAAAGFGGAGALGGNGGQHAGQGGSGGTGGFGGTAGFGGTGGVGGASGYGGFNGGDGGVPIQCEPEDAGLDADTPDAGDAACVPTEDASVGDAQD